MKSVIIRCTVFKRGLKDIKIHVIPHSKADDALPKEKIHFCFSEKTTLWYEVSVNCSCTFISETMLPNSVIFISTYISITLCLY